MMVPTLHLNGTSRNELIRQISDAAEAIRKAIEAMNAAYPNGRDYYVQGPDATSKALAEHRERQRRLQSVSDELFEIWEGINDQKGGRS